MTKYGGDVLLRYSNPDTCPPVRVLSTVGDFEEAIRRDDRRIASEGDEDGCIARHRDLMRTFLKRASGKRVHRNGTKEAM